METKAKNKRSYWTLNISLDFLELFVNYEALDQSDMGLLGLSLEFIDGGFKTKKKAYEHYRELIDVYRKEGILKVGFKGFVYNTLRKVTIDEMVKTPEQEESQEI